MKPTEDIERFVRRGKPDVTTGRTMDERVLNDSFEAMDRTIRASRTSAAGGILRSRAARLAAAAAVIIVAAGLLMVYRKPPVQQPRIISQVKSPAEMLTAMSLNMAWRRGGIEAVDEQSARAFEMLGAGPAKASIQELLAELNGV